MLDITKQPAEVHKWQKEGRKVDGMLDVTDNIEQFSSAWFSWWKSLQPEWQINSDGLLTEDYGTPKECDWLRCKRVGQIVFICCLSLLAGGESQQRTAVKRCGSIGGKHSLTSIGFCARCSISTQSMTLPVNYLKQKKVPPKRGEFFFLSPNGVVITDIVTMTGQLP